MDAKCEWEGCFAPSEGGLDFHIGETTKSFIEEIPDETIIIGVGGGGEIGTRPWGGESQLFQSREQPVSPRPAVGRLHATSRSSDLQETTGRSCMTSSGGVPAGHPRARHVRGGEGPRGQGEPAPKPARGALRPALRRQTRQVLVLPLLVAASAELLKTVGCCEKIAPGFAL